MRKLTAMLLTATLAGCASSITPAPDIAGTLAADLTDTDWLMLEVRGRKAVPSDKPIQLHFATEGNRLVAFGGCNTLSGKWSHTGMQLQISNVASTRMTCPTSALTRQEQDMVRALESTQRFERSQNVLTLQSADGVVMRLRAVNPE